jgi:hypothetical protein
MKWLVWFLLAANLAVAGYFLAGSRWSARTAEQNAPLHVDRLSLRSQSRAETVPAAAPPTPVRNQALCVEWRGLNAGEFAQVREQLKALAGERVMSFAEMPVNTRQWVIFPPLPSAQSAAEKLNELTAAGVSDAFVVKDGPWRNAISLGLYANAEAAGRRVHEVEGKGVLGTRVEAQPKQGTDFYFVIKSEDQDVLKSLGDIKQPYTGSRQSRIACPS